MQALSALKGDRDNGRLFRTLTIVNGYTRESLAIEARQTLKEEDIVGVLNRLKLERGVPKVLFYEHSAEVSGQAMGLWAYSNSVKIDFSRSGKLTENAFVESFNGTFRAECLDTRWFMDLKEARHLIETWRHEYTEMA